MPATEDVERQVAIAVVIAVEEPPFLVAVQWIIGGVQIEDDLTRRLFAVSLGEHIHEGFLDSRRVVADLVIARRFGAAQFKPVQGTLTGHRRTVRAMEVIKRLKNEGYAWAMVLWLRRTAD